MSQRELIILGTSAQVPTKYRNHNGYFLRWDQDGFLFDPGEGVQRQMIYANVSTSMISKIFISHFHGDHCLGLAGISQRISLDKVPHTIQIYYPASGQVYYERLRNASVFFDVAKIEDCPIFNEGVIFEDEKFTITAKHLSHSIETFGYRIQEKDSCSMLPDKLNEFGIYGAQVAKIKNEGELKINDRLVKIEEVSIPKPGQSMAFAMDTRMCTSVVELARNVSLLVSEATYLDEHKQEADERGHLTASQAATIAREANAEKLILSHFSQRYFRIESFIDEAKIIFPNVHIARDCEKIAMPKRKKLTV